MLTKPNAEALLCLKRLTSDEFRPLLQYLAGENGQVLAALMTVNDEVVLRQFQGRAQALHDLLSQIDLARSHN